jgi:DNA helicase-2/ATP-dependent DNA helicase PcrA
MRGFIHGAVAESIRTVLSLSGMETALREEAASASEADVDRWANVQELITAAVRYDEEVEEPTLDDFLRRAALTSDQDAVDESAGVVMLMTLHAAKGLEFPVVFIAAMEDGLLPHERAIKGGDDIEEERRLCFVGITRAKEQLVLTRARERFIAGKRTPRALSRFLLELPPEELQQRSFVDPFAEARHRARLSSRDDVTPMDDQLPPDEYEARRRTFSGGSGRARGGFGSASPRRGASPTRETADETTAALRPAADSPYAGWGAGTFVEHKQYGVGQVVWIRPSPGQTRAAIRFPRAGEKTFVLEKAPVRKLAKQRG